MQWWWSRRGLIPNQHEDQPTKLPFMLFLSNGKSFPLTLKTEQGANLQRQQTGRGPCRCGLGSSCCVNHVQISTQAKGTRHLCHRVQSREEMKGLNLFLSGQRIIWPWRPGGPVLDTGSTWYNRVTALLHPLLNVGIISTTTVRSRIPV